MISQSTHGAEMPTIQQDKKCFDNSNIFPWSSICSSHLPEDRTALQSVNPVLLTVFVFTPGFNISSWFSTKTKIRIFGEIVKCWKRNYVHKVLHPFPGHDHLAPIIFICICCCCCCCWNWLAGTPRICATSRGLRTPTVPPYLRYSFSKSSSGFKFPA